MPWPSLLNHRSLTTKLHKQEPSVPEFLQPANRARRRVLSWLSTELNFYRIHVLVFVFTPLLASLIFWGSNEDVQIAYIDCLFVCVSAMTVTGLVTFNVSTATVWQQVILYILMWIGNISAVSVIMIYVRRHFFRVKFNRVIKNNAAARKRAQDVEKAVHLERRKDIIRLRRLVGLGGSKRRHDPNHDHNSNRDQRESEDAISSGSSASIERLAEAEIEAERLQKLRKKKEGNKKKRGPLRADMIVRVDQPAVLINGNGLPSSGRDSGRRSIEEDNATRIQPDRSGGLPGGILNTTEHSLHQAMAAAPPGQPFVHVSSPEVAPSQPRRRVVTGSGDTLFCDSPQEMRSDITRNRSGSSEGPSVRLDRGTGLERTRRVGEGDDCDEAVSAGLPPFSALPRIDQGRMSHFDEDAVAPSLMRRRRGSDPAGGDSHRVRRDSEPALQPMASGARGGRSYGQLRGGLTGIQGDDRMPRSQTIEFAEPPRPHTLDRLRFQEHHPERGYTTGVMPQSSGGIGLPRARTMDRTYTTSGFTPIALTRSTTTAKDRGFGGFPTPFEIAGTVLSKALPRARERLRRTTTMPRSGTIASTHAYSMGNSLTYDASSRTAPYLSFDVNVTGNSMFHSLTEAQRDELGGVEYRALDLLAKIVPIYFIGCNLFMIVLVAPYLASSAFDKYRPVFQSQAPHAPNTTWFWLFNTISAYSNTGMSLIDTSMIQMADAYFLLIPMAILILIGNTAFPIFLRFWVWICSLCVPKDSRSYETLRFILDHPRRCFIYLFPSGQTWFLLFIVIGLTVTDWVAFEVLDIGNPTSSAIPVPQRIFDGLFQSIAVRAGGFQVVSLLNIAPAVQFLYVVMMYISAYPIALSVRSTNVYEERSLGVFTEKNGGEDEDDDLSGAPNAKRWGSYLTAHARRQLAFDMWWLGFALWLVCIIERSHIQDPESNGWFTVFSCLFELTSAYGTVGLSTGSPDDAFSLSGQFRTLSKLVVIATMIRGRHRGLPVAIDRSIMLPNDLDDQDAAEEAWSIVDPERTRSMDRRNGSISYAANFLGGSKDGGDGVDSQGPADGGVGGGTSDYKIARSPSPLLFLAEPQSYNEYPPSSPDKTTPNTETFNLDPITADKMDMLNAEKDSPSSVTLPHKQEGDSSPSSSLKGSHHSDGSLKGKEKEKSTLAGDVSMPAVATAANVVTADAGLRCGKGTEGHGDVVEEDDTKLAAMFGSSAAHLIHSNGDDPTSNRKAG